MRSWLSLFVSVFVSVLVAGAWPGEIVAQQELSTQGRVKPLPTGIEVTSPLTDLQAVPGRILGKNDTRVVEYVDRMVREYDTNKDGFIDSTEWKEGRWSTPPEESDRNQDGKLSRDELQERIARRFGFVSAPGAPADAKPTRKMIAFEFVLIERSGTELAGGKEKTPTAEELLKLEKDGKAGTVQRFKLTALENVEARLQLGEDAPFVSGRSIGGGRGGFGGSVPSQESITYNSLGTTITLTAETETDGKVLASINLARSTVAAAKAPEKAEGQEAGVSANYPRRLQGTIVTTVRIAPGEPTVIAGQQTHSGSSPGELWVLVSAKVE